MTDSEGPNHDVRAALEGFWAGADLTPEQRARWVFASRRYGPIVDFLKASPPTSESRVLDLGGGVGSLSVALHARFGGHYDLADLEPPPPGKEAHYAKFGIESFRSVRLDQASSMDALPRGYDLVLFVEVLEHLLVDPLVLFRGIYDRLGPQGRLLLTTPNMARVGNRVKLLRGRSIKERERFPQDGSGGYGHVIEYTLDELDYLLGWESFVRERSRIVQHIPNPNPSRLQRMGVPWLNTGLAQTLRLGDDMLALYRPVPRPPPGTPRPARI
ncbi:MAG TPA: class I SAM-dependent methyltransferase [Thermoplasmata archaeon]|nr:class I SAM-dependent methyltransferase [Thermoplasmata archaeon]